MISGPALEVRFPHAPPLLGGSSSCLGAEPPPDPPNKRFLAVSNLIVGDHCASCGERKAIDKAKVLLVSGEQRESIGECDRGNQSICQQQAMT